MKPICRFVCPLVVFSALASAQTQLEMFRLLTPRFLEFSPDGLRLWYKLGNDW